MITKDDFIKHFTSGKPTEYDQVKKASTEDNDVLSQTNESNPFDINNPYIRSVFQRGVLQEMANDKKTIMAKIKSMTQEKHKSELIGWLKLLSSILKVEEWAIKGLRQKN